MQCKTTTTGRQHTGGHPRLAAGQAAHGHHHRPPATRADAARAAPFAAQWPYQSFLELGALAGAPVVRGLNHSERVPVSPACCPAIASLPVGRGLTMYTVHCNVNSVSKK